MLQAGGDPDLAQESLRGGRGRQLGRKQFHRHRAPVAGVGREKDPRHGPAPQLPLDVVLPLQHRLQPGLDRLAHSNPTSFAWLSSARRAVSSRRGRGTVLRQRTE